ncbi:MAG: hypothetical protein RL150_128 [Candidatus Parcubacteria bacterium]|jgi:phosphoribosylformylglycinamidine cyclo-ligase
MKTAYDETIVDPGDRASKLAHSVCVNSFGNNSIIEVAPIDRSGSFRGPVDYVYRSDISRAIGDGRVLFIDQNDGAGSKPHFAGILGTEEAFGNLGYEVLAMCVDDIARFGGMPVAVANQVDARAITSKNIHLFQALMRGFTCALRDSRCICTTGETAIMTRNITGFGDDGGPDSLWMTHSASAHGIIRPNMKLFPQRDIVPGMPIIGLGERGYRCNGGTQFTRIIEKLWGGVRSLLLRNAGARSFIEALTAPSVIYSPYVTVACGWDQHGTERASSSGVLGIAHITGGGVWKKFSEMLPDGVGADLDRMPAPPQVLLQAQQLAAEAGIPMTDHECYGTFHGGCGMLVVCKSDHTALAFMHRLKSLGLSDRVSVQQVGVTTASPEKEIRIQSRFAGGDELSSLRPPQ